MRTLNDKVGLAVGMTLTLICALIVSAVLPQFRASLEAFGAEMPLLTVLFLDYYLCLWVLPAVVLAFWLTWPQVNQRGAGAAFIGIGTVAVVAPLAVFALYIPIFKLGAVI